MASAPFVIDDSAPADNAIISQFPTAERSFRDIVSSYLDTNHNPTTGNHKWLTLDEQSSAPSGLADKFVLYYRAGVLYYKNDNGSETAFQEFAAGTKVVFYQASAPTGYTQDTSITDRVLRVVSTAGGGTGGSWTISGISVNDHTLSQSRIPAHTHTYVRKVSGSGGAEPGSTIAGDDDTQNTGSTGGSDPHGHGMTLGSSWRPAYANVIVGTKNA
jgi:hypothetical protein